MTQPAQMSVAVVGLWHQGVVGAACLADLGYDVLGVDPDANRIEHLNAGQAPLFEPGLNELLQDALRSGRLRFSADMEGGVVGRSYVLIMFDTPVDDNDESDLSGIFSAVRSMAPNLEPDTVILVTAQVPVGTCDDIANVIREVNPSATFGIAYSPENLRLGQAIKLFREPALPVIGSDEEATLDAVERLFSELDAQWERVSLRTAEMVKHGLNAFLATSISFGNELGNLCDAVGADGKRLAEILRLEPRIGHKAMLFPGLGFSGGTIARDMQTLRGVGRIHGVPTKFLDGVWEANRTQNGVVLRKLRRQLDDLHGRRIAVLGLTYKPDTSTLRRSASLEIISELHHHGAVIRAHDPKADRAELTQYSGFDFCEDVYDAVKDADAVVVLTAWSEYKDLDFERIRDAMAGPLVVDPNGALDADRLLGLGFTYLDVGRGR